MKNDEKEEKISNFSYRDINELYEELENKKRMFDNLTIIHPNASFSYIVYIGNNECVLSIKVTLNGN